MPLRKALLEAPLSSGLNQATDRRDLVVDGATQMQNCVRNKQGAIRKRVGCAQLVSTTVGRTFGADFTASPIAGIRGINYQRAPLVFDGYTVREYSDAQSKWRLLDATPEAVADNRLALVSGVPLATVSPQIPPAGDVDYCSALNYYVCAYIYANSTSKIFINTTIIDATSGAVIQPVISIDISGNVGVPRLVICGTIAIVVYISAARGLVLQKIDLTNISAGWSSVVLDASASLLGYGYDIGPMVGDITRFVVGYFRASNVSVFATVSVASLAALHTFTNTTATGTGNSVAVAAATGEWCWIAYSVSPGASTQVFQTWAFNDANNAQISPIAGFTTTPAPLTFGQVAIAKFGVSDAAIFYTNQDSAAGPPFLLSTYSRQVSALSGGSVLVGVQNIPGMQIYSKLAKVTTPLGDRWYSLMYVNSSLQGTIALVAHDWVSPTLNGISGGRLVTTVAPRLVKTMGASAGGAAPGGIYAATKLSNVSATTLTGLLPVNESLTLSTLFAQTFEFESKTRFFGAPLGSTLLGLSTGAPVSFDGQMMAEMGYIYYPEAITTVSTVGGPLTGAYSYIITYEWPDAAGNTHRSATSPPVNLTVSAKQITLTLPTMGLTWRQRRDTALASTYNNFTVYNGTTLVPPVCQLPKICIYRTVASGATYYFVGSIYNDPTVSSLTFTDTTIDLVLQQRSLLYTTGGVLDNYCPPSAKICISHKSRWFLAGCDDPTVIWPSKAYTYGEAPGFNEQMNLNASGAVTGLASLDEKLIVFVKRGDGAYGIEYVVGDGPFDTGASNDWTNPPQPIPSSVGAIDQRSIVVCELGVMFLSPTGAPNGGGGIFLLSRDLQVHYISGAVEDLIDANPVCTGAVIHPSQGRAYFEMARVDNVTTSTGGVRLVYDWLAQCWSSDTHFDFAQSIDGLAARTTWVAGGLGSTTAGNANMPLVYWANSAGAVFRENSGLAVANSYVDVSNTGTQHWITMQFSSAWFKPALSGFARFWRVQLEADRLDPASCGITYTFDYASAVYYSESDSWTDTQIAAFDRAPQVDVEHLVGNQKAKAIAVQIIDQQPSGSFSTGQGISWATISIECGVDDGGRYQNLPSGQRS